MVALAQLHAQDGAARRKPPICTWSQKQHGVEGTDNTGIETDVASLFHLELQPGQQPRDSPGGMRPLGPSSLPQGARTCLLPQTAGMDTGHG